jgi:hypothetical protein
VTYISVALRQEVIVRAEGCCEYCRLHNDNNFIAHEIDHIIAEKHHGETNAANLCLSCFDCNRSKGSDIASIDLETSKLTPLFHPRHDTWSSHFRLDGATILGTSAVGRVTIHVLKMNSVDQIIKRAELLQMGEYPC